MLAIKQHTSAANAFLVCLEPTARVWWLQMSFFTTGEANRALPNPLAEFEGPLQGEGKRGGKERKKREGTKWREKTSRETNFWLWPWCQTIVCLCSV